MDDIELIRLAKSRGGNSIERFTAEYLRKYPNGDAAAAYNIWRQMDIDSPTETTSPLKRGVSILNSGVSKMSSISGDILETQMGKADNGPFSNVTSDILDIFKTNGLNLFKIGLDGISLIYENILKQLSEESTLHSEINTKIGISGELSNALRVDMVNASIESTRYGTTLSDIGDFYIRLTENSGKFTLINKKFIDESVPLAASLGMTLSDLAQSINEFQNVGISADNTLKSVSEATIKTVSLGMSARKVVDTMQGSISKLNEYGFQNGIKGLEEMSRKSIEFRMSLDDVFKIADKVFDPEGAIDLVANLQALGGAVGDLNDPFKLTYMATNNIEGIQDALIGAASSLATYNNEQQRFEITGINLRRGKAMADALGVSYQELAKGAISAAERIEAASSIMSTGIEIDEESREFLINLSTMKNGEMKIIIPESLQDKLGKQNEVSLNNLTKTQIDVLLKNKEAFEKMSPKDMALAQLTETQQMSRGIDVIAAYYRVTGSQMLRGVTQSALDSTMLDMKTAIDKFSKSFKLENDLTKKTKADVDNISMSSVTNFVMDKVGLTSKPSNIVQSGIQRIEKYVKQEIIFKSDNTLDQIRREQLKNSGLGFSFANEENERSFTQ